MVRYGENKVNNVWFDTATVFGDHGCSMGIRHASNRHRCRNLFACTSACICVHVFLMASWLGRWGVVESNKVMNE